jgi:hypothetical protein
LPDVPLLFLTLWYFREHGFGFGEHYDRLFYDDPVWLISHNVFHAPLVALAIAILGAALWYARRDGGTTSTPGNAPGRSAFAAHLLSFAFAIGLHSILDIFTHNDDGPLLLFPFDWSVRFSSPVSYWDPEHYGNIFMPIDLGLTLVFGGLLIAVWVRRRRTRRADRPDT